MPDGSSRAGLGTSATAAGPDFLCVGMQKAGTGWLFDQLQHHPEFWMPPIKELHYFDRDFPDVKIRKTLNRARRAPETLERKRERDNWRPLTETDHAFFRDVEAAAGSAGALAPYERLFVHKGTLKSGDITPAYCGLPDETIAAIAARFPSLRVIVLLRDPVARAWSQISMTHRRGKFDLRCLTDMDRLSDFLNSHAVTIRSFPTQIVARWRRHIPEDRFAHFFFDDIAQHPDQVRAAALRFLGADPALASGDLSAGYNSKATQARLDLTEPVKRHMARHFAGEMRACAETFGGHARAWLAKYDLPPVTE